MLGAKPLGSAVTVVIAGELDHFAAPQIRRRLDELLEDQTVTHLVLDLENLTFMDSSGIAVLLRTCRRMREMDGQFQVIQVPRQAGRVLRAAGLQNMMPIAFSGEEE